MTHNSMKTLAIAAALSVGVLSSASAQMVYFPPGFYDEIPQGRQYMRSYHPEWSGEAPFVVQPYYPPAQVPSPPMQTCMIIKLSPGMYTTSCQ